VLLETAWPSGRKPWRTVSADVLAAVHETPIIFKQASLLLAPPCHHVAGLKANWAACQDDRDLQKVNRKEYTAGPASGLNRHIPGHPPISHGVGSPVHSRTPSLARSAAEQAPAPEQALMQCQKACIAGCSSHTSLSARMSSAGYVGQDRRLFQHVLS
jgi:hypothetical protein